LALNIINTYDKLAVYEAKAKIEFGVDKKGEKQ
jgi:hypothetical protein